MNCFLFEGIEAQVKNVILQKLDAPAEIEKNSELYRVGSIGIILSGNARICRMDDTGESVTVRNISEGELFGVAGVFGEWSKEKSHIVATKPCRVLYITEAQLRSILMQYPTVAVNYITFLTEKIKFLNRRTDTFSAKSASHKLYEHLISVADSDGKVSLKIGLAELARRLKMGRSSLYRSLDELQSNGLLKKENGVLILKEPDALK